MHYSCDERRGVSPVFIVITSNISRDLWNTLFENSCTDSYEYFIVRNTHTPNRNYPIAESRFLLGWVFVPFPHINIITFPRAPRFPQPPLVHRSRRIAFSIGLPSFENSVLSISVFTNRRPAHAESLKTYSSCFLPVLSEWRAAHLKATRGAPLLSFLPLPPGSPETVKGRGEQTELGFPALLPFVESASSLSMWILYGFFFRLFESRFHIHKYNTTQHTILYPGGGRRWRTLSTFMRLSFFLCFFLLILYIEVGSWT